MSQGFLQIDGVPEQELPAHTKDDKSGDRVSLLEGGLLHVEGGRATFAPWSDIVAVREDESSVYVDVPRRPPSPPFIEITAERRQDLPMEELRRRVMAHRAVSYPWRNFVQGAIFLTFFITGFIVMEVFSAAGHMGADPSQAPGLSLIGYAIFIAFVAAGGGLAVFVGKMWKKIKDRTMERQRLRSG